MCELELNTEYRCTCGHFFSTYASGNGPLPIVCPKCHQRNPLDAPPGKYQEALEKRSRKRLARNTS